MNEILLKETLLQFQIINTQECIPVGCVLSAASAVSVGGCVLPTGVCFLGVCASGGCASQGDVCFLGGCLPGCVLPGGCASGGCASQGGVHFPGGVPGPGALQVPPPCEQTDTCKNNLRNFVADGNK